MAISVTGDERQIVERPRGQRGLQRVVVGVVRMRHIVDIFKVRVLRVIGAIGDGVALAAGDFGRRIWVDHIEFGNGLRKLP